MAGSIAVFCSGMVVVYNAVRSLALVVGAAMVLAAAQLALKADSPVALLVAVGFGLALVLALWAVWRPHSGAHERAPGTRESMFSLQRQVRGFDVKRLMSGVGAVFGACVILFISFAAMTGGSVMAGIMFFCSGVMAMRAAWTLLWAQRGARGL